MRASATTLWVSLLMLAILCRVLYFLNRLKSTFSPVWLSRVIYLSAYVCKHKCGALPCLLMPKELLGSPESL